MLFWKRKDWDYHPRSEPKYSLPLCSENLKKVFENCDDFAIRTVYIGGNSAYKAQICFIDGVVSGEAVSREVLASLAKEERFSALYTDKQRLEAVLHGAVSSYAPICCKTMDDTVTAITDGFCAIIFDNIQTAVCFEVKTSDKRAVSQPVTEKAIKGSKDAFVESLRTNTSLIRRKLREPLLKITETIVGRRSLTKVAVVYVQGLTNMDIVAQVRRKIDEIDIDALLTSSSIEEYITDAKKTMFPLVISTERADKFSVSLMQGKVGILVDGLPMGYLVPATLAQTLEVPEDRAQHFAISTAIMIVRYLAMFICLLLPAFYVAIAMYHQEMLPTKLLLSIIESKQNVPFSTAAEVLGMLIVFELLQEAGLRLPEPVGQTVSIIGALIVGQSAVEAKVISPVVVIVVAVAGVAGYAMPNQDMSAALRAWRFIFTVAAMLGGMYGLMLAVVVLVYHLASLESFGVPYMSPFVSSDGWKVARRSVLRLPMKSEKYRDDVLKPENKRMQK